MAIAAPSILAASTSAREAREMDAIIDILPPRVRKVCSRLNKNDIIEVVLDLGRLPEIRMTNSWQDVIGEIVKEDDLQLVTKNLSAFGTDNRAGIPATLHRISAIRAKTGEVIGLTCRFGRAIQGTADLVKDIIESGSSILILGAPGVGKTTILRETARILAEQKRVVIVDTSNEIAGDSHVPHYGVGRARRMPVAKSNLQHEVMIEAVENHMPEVIVIDEIGTEAECLAARTIAERGVQLIGTAHGKTLENLMANPTLSDLIGGITSVTLSDEEAKRRASRKTVLERKAPPTFDILIEIRARNHYAIHTDLGVTVDAILLGKDPKPEIREITAEGEVTVVEGDMDGYFQDDGKVEEEHVEKSIFLYGITHDKAIRAIAGLGVNAVITRRTDEADMIIALKAIEYKNSAKIAALRSENIPVKIVNNNTVTKIQGALKELFGIQTEVDGEEAARNEAELAAHRIVADGRSVNLTPRAPHIRRMQHELAKEHGLESLSIGIEPHRYLRMIRAGTK